MTYDLLIKNGKVVLESIVTVTDIAVKNGKIVAIGNDLNEGKEVIDAEGLIVSPGMIDAHMHISEPGRTEWEGYETGTRALAKGGATTCIEMPLNQLPATIDRKTLHTKFEAGREKLNVDVASFGGLVPHNLDRLHELAEEGVAAYKCFLSTCGSKKEGSIDFRNVDDYSFFKGLQTLGKLDKIVAVHCENATICDKLGEEAKASGKTTAHDYVASRPVLAEVEAVRRAIYLAKEANCQLHICHISCPEAVEEVTIARQSGQKVTCESCGHYFAITTDEFEKIGNTAKCSPPIRDKENQNRMWEKVLKGEIDLIASDHSPCTPELKKGGVFEAWGGISAAQNTLDIFFDEAVQKRGMSLNLFAQLIATNPAKIFHLKNKGSITIGKDADFVLIKPNSSYVLKSEDLEYKNKISAYVGRTINAQVARTILRGKTIYELSKGIVEPHTGEFILCQNS